MCEAGEEPFRPMIGHRGWINIKAVLMRWTCDPTFYQRACSPSPWGYRVTHYHSHYRSLDTHALMRVCIWISKRGSDGEKMCLCDGSPSICMFAGWVAILSWHRPPPSAGCRMTLAVQHGGSAATRLSPGREGSSACAAQSPSLACSLLSSIWPIAPPVLFSCPSVSPATFPLLHHVSFTSSVPELFSPCFPLPPPNHFLPYLYYSLQTLFFGVPPEVLLQHGDSVNLIFF